MTREHEDVLIRLHTQADSYDASARPVEYGYQPAGVVAEAVRAALSRPAPPDALALRHAWEAGFRLCRSYGDNHHHFDGEQKERKWRDYIEGLAAPAPVAAPAPIGESPLAHAAVEATARAHGWDAESDTLAGWLHTRLSVAAPAPETPKSVQPEANLMKALTHLLAPETPAPDAMPEEGPRCTCPVRPCGACDYDPPRTLRGMGDGPYLPGQTPRRRRQEAQP